MASKAATEPRTSKLFKHSNMLLFNLKLSRGASLWQQGDEDIKQENRVSSFAVKRYPWSEHDVAGNVYSSSWPAHSMDQPCKQIFNTCFKSMQVSTTPNPHRTARGSATQIRNRSEKQNRLQMEAIDVHKIRKRLLISLQKMLEEPIRCFIGFRD